MLNQCKSKIKEIRRTFFRVKLMFESDYLGPQSLGPLDLWTLGPLPSYSTNLILPLNSSYLFLLLSSFGIVLTLEIEIDNLRLTFELSLY